MERLSVFKRLRTNPWLVWWWEIRDFIFFIGRYTVNRVNKLLEEVESGKDVIVDGLVVKRGRYAQPFLHTGMTGLFVLGLFLAPILTQAANEEASQGQGGTLSINGGDMMEMTTSVSVKPRDVVVTYIVQPGDTVSSIAAKFDVSVDTIRWQNNLQSIDEIKPGDKLEVPPITGMVHKVKRGETVYSIAKKYDVSAQQIINWPFNSYANDETFELAAGQVLVVPDGVKSAEILWDPKRYVAQRTPDAGPGAGGGVGQFIWPTSGNITQRYVWYHRALDIANSGGPNVAAADNGRVIVAGWPDNFGYGNRVMIDHGNGFVTLYGHLAQIFVTTGQTVRQGDAIGKMGSTGRSTGTHLHFEIRQGGAILNPLDYLK